MSISKSLVMLNSIDREDLTNLEQHPNVGPAIADDLRRIGLKRPQELTGQDPYALFDALCRETGARHDPCVIECSSRRFVLWTEATRNPGGRLQPSGRSFSRRGIVSGSFEKLVAWASRPCFLAEEMHGRDAQCHQLYVAHNMAMHGGLSSLARGWFN